MSTKDYISGEIVLIDKPYKWTSFDVVNRIRALLKKQLKKKNLKVGHAGTLDPLATGLLIVCTGAMTKKADEYQAYEKEYTGTFTLGATTPSYDLETEVTGGFPTNHINEALIKQAARKLSGTYHQTPPIFSAIKIDGERAYEKARRGEAAHIKSKEITISEFEITAIRMPEVDFRIVCSKGTYIRSLANDFGKELQSGAYLSSLCRTRIGTFNLVDAITIDDFKKDLESF
jgi:tRNA pseudouridine55 synthase